MNRIALFVALLVSVAAPRSANSQTHLETDGQVVSPNGTQTLLSTESGAGAWLGTTASYEFLPPGWTSTGPVQDTCDKTLPANRREPGVLQCRVGITRVWPCVDRKGKQHVMVWHVGTRMRPTAMWIDGVPQKLVDVTPPVLAASDAALINGEDYVPRQINCDGDHVFVDGTWRADGTTEIPSSGGPLIVHCGLPGAPRFGPPDVYLSGPAPHPRGGIAPATERAATTSQVGSDASAAALWYMIHPGGLAGVNHWAACSGVIFVALDPAPSLAGTRWRDWTAEGPIKDRHTCEDLTKSDRRGGAVCVPEDDPR